MPPPTTSAPDLRQANFRFRCIACADLSDTARQDFRCAQCGDLLEITYPHRKDAGPDAAELKSAWRQRRLSHSAIDLSGVWRFRDLLPALARDDQAITLREGNTPLYELPQCARITGVPRLFARTVNGAAEKLLVGQIGPNLVAVGEGVGKLLAKDG